MKLRFEVGNDNGNSEQKMTVNDTLHLCPNVYSVVTSTVGHEDTKPENLIGNLLDHLYVTIQSRHLNQYTQSVTVFVGKRALAEGENVRNMSIRMGEKHKEDIPLINTLANLAAIAVQKAFEKKGEIVKDINLSVDMTTALPASQWNETTAREFSNRFMEHEHTVIVHLGNTDINVKIDFTYVKTVKEGVIALFALMEDGKEAYRNDDIFDEFIKEYKLEKIDGSYFEDLQILHSDIGDGTNEYAITRGYEVSNKTHGEDHGVGHAIESAIKKFEQIRNYKMTRQEFSELIKTPGKRFHDTAVECLRSAKEELANLILIEIKETIKDMKFDIDVVMAYGGGSIQMKDVLYKPLKEFLDANEMKLLWINEKNATTLNMQGLNIFTKTLLKDAKKEALQK
ncbi:MULTISPECIES: ParM/StbA family protein [Bacillus cereus group]|uniref:ParM/StbA family protein n=1 Tax=Bacillus cereus group TaxID=86661 RepID=UPI0021CF8865|nr:MULTISPECIES: ParM/StbA family protein [Bacillus cereus group]MCU5201638.1 ParM/StbA family protein [Bacillus paranthracis]MCU5374718.1 ParM/StbA family protein [Bacillus pacificus]